MRAWLSSRHLRAELFLPDSSCGHATAYQFVQPADAAGRKRAEFFAEDLAIGANQPLIRVTGHEAVF